MKKEETKLRNRIIQALEEKFPGGYFRHTHGNPFQHVGLPDIFGCINGRYLGIEVKNPGEKAKRIQELELQSIEKAGGVTGVATSIPEAIDIAQNCLIPYKSN